MLLMTLTLILRMCCVDIHFGVDVDVEVDSDLWGYGA